MRFRWISFSLLFLFFCSSVLAGYQYNSSTGTRDYCLTMRSQVGTVSNTRCVPVEVSPGALTTSGEGKNLVYVLRAGLASGGATSMTTAETTVSTSYSQVDKKISNDPAYASGTLADSIPGSVLTIRITEVNGSGVFALSPDTATGFTSIVFAAVDDIVSLLYVDDTVGWIILSDDRVFDVVTACDASSSSQTINLPAIASVSDRTYHVKKIDTSGNTCTIDPASSETVDGSTTISLMIPYQAVSLKAKDGQWYIF